MNITHATTRPRALVALAAATAAALALTGCVSLPGPLAGPRVETDHEVSDAVHALRLETAGDVEVRLGDEPGLSIRAPKSVSDRLTVREHDGTLVLGISGAGWTSGNVDYVLTVLSFDELDLTGAGDVTADFSDAESVAITVGGAGDVRATDLDARDVVIRVTGAGSVRVDGSADSGDFVVTGAGSISAGELEVRDAQAEITGAGDIHVHASDTLDAVISGLGDIRVSGGARVTSDISGLGDVVED